MKTKDVINTIETKPDVNDEYGRMDYLGVDMAFIYIRGKLMFTMSEVARKLYPLWPRTTLNDRVKHMKILWHTCTTKEIEKVVSVKGIVKLGVHCTLISKKDLDTFCSVYKVGAPAGSRQHVFKPTSVKETENKADRSMKTGKQISAGSKIKRTAGIKSHSFRSNYRKQSEVKGNKGKTRVIVKGIKLDNGKALDGHVVNNTTGKQAHVVKQGRYSAKSKQSNKIQTKTGVGRPKKRKLSTVKNEAETKGYGYIPTKRHRKMREPGSPESDSVSYDSGISSLQLDAPAQLKSAGARKNNIADLKPGRLLTTKSRKQLKIKEAKKKYNIMKTKKEKQKGKEIVIGGKRKNEVIKRGRKSKKSEGINKRKMDSCSNTITKDLIMDLKHMNDKDLINSFSPLSSPTSTNTTPSEDQSCLFKLMPVKPVWRVNSSFKFISNFQLPPSLVVQNGQLSPACSMMCSKGWKPPSAHPIWKWKVGEAVVSNKTVISYRMKKVKCT